MLLKWGAQLQQNRRRRRRYAAVARGRSERLETGCEAEVSAPRDGLAPNAPCAFGHDHNGPWVVLPRQALAGDIIDALVAAGVLTVEGVLVVGISVRGVDRVDHLGELASNDLEPVATPFVATTA